ncbi:hypothetical protein MTO96_042559 [Rhipicephalus appendiculatus]
MYTASHTPTIYAQDMLTLVKRHHLAKCAQSKPRREVPPDPTWAQLQQQTDQDGPGPPEIPAEPNTNDTLEHEGLSPSKHAQQPVPKDLAESSAPAAASESPEPPTATSKCSCAQATRLVST